jgi:DNA-binding GntR family transcriptional regulator
MPKPPVRAQELAAQLAAQIRAGEPAPGSWLPSERQLAETHAVSRTTARAALQNLAELGLVRVVPGSGVQVQAVAERVTVPEMQRTLDWINAQLDEIKARLARLEAAAGNGEPAA